jgi:hypothetical protein
MPPQEAAEVQVAQLVELAAEPLAELLPQPAASKIAPTAAAVATIVFDARKVKPSPARPQ